ncbi:MAG: AAA family ATPase, partial [Bacteroidales bacterium]|nr:AAA family ATPase [Bacteroidales bacterium]
MGTYINIGNAGFQRARNSEYVDKSGLIPIVNRTLNTERSFSCVTRSRRFGKSLAAVMLAAYYDHSCDSRSLFADLEIAKDPDFEKHLNKFPVIYLDMTGFITRYHTDDIVHHIDATLKADIAKAYPQLPNSDDDNLMDLLIRIHEATCEQFIFIIDEWDAICREFKPGSRAMDLYVSWLRRMFKDVSGKYVFAGVYMTGILPIKKYSTQSALNNFVEYSMVEPRQMGRYFGFTKDEVRALAAKYGMDFDDLEKWYDGYQIGDEQSMFNPNSVMQAVDAGRCRSYWASTGAYDAITPYISMNFEGLKDDIIRMLGGGRCHVDTTSFRNDMAEVNSRDDVLTVLIHLGYLSYNWRKEECYIPNHDVEGE